ncbi:MAG TPA: hypothetical protein VH682_02870 [Gemmataceae bacterium]
MRYKRLLLFGVPVLAALLFAAWGYRQAQTLPAFSLCVACVFY